MRERFAETYRWALMCLNDLRIIHLANDDPFCQTIEKFGLIGS